MEFKEIPVEEARAGARNLRIDSKVEEMLVEHLQKLQVGKAWEITLSAGEQGKRVKNQIETVAKVRLNNLPIAVRNKNTNTLVCWKLSDEEIEERKIRGAKLQAGREKNTGGRKRK